MIEKDININRRKMVCLRGHDTSDPSQRDTKGTCKECKRMHEWWRNYRRLQVSMEKQMLVIQSLEELLKEIERRILCD